MKFGAAIAAILLAILGYISSPYWTYSVREVKVINTMVKPTGGESKYLIYTDDGVYENTDSWHYFKFDSSDIQAKVVNGQEYQVGAYGFRIPFMSKYPNVTFVEKKNQ